MVSILVSSSIFRGRLMLLKDVADIIFSFPQKSKEIFENTWRWLSSSCLQEDNRLFAPQEENDFIPDENLRVYCGDVIIRRVQPQFVNYISEDTDYMVGQNLAIVRAKNNIYPKYLAFILEINLGNLYKDMAGTVVPAIKRSSFDELDIGDLPNMEKQRAIGEVWWLLKEKRNLNQRLLQQERMLMEYTLKRLVKHRGN